MSTEPQAECPQCRDWGKYELHSDHWPPTAPARPRRAGGVMNEHTTENDAHDCERGDALEAMVERMAESHVALQEAVAWALAEAVAWRDKMPRTRENHTYENGRQDGVDAAVTLVRAAVSVHLRGEDPTSVLPSGETTP